MLVMKSVYYLQTFILRVKIHKLHVNEEHTPYTSLYVYKYYCLMACAVSIQPESFCDGNRFRPLGRFN